MKVRALVSDIGCALQGSCRELLLAARNRALNDEALQWREITVKAPIN
jgi:hypothetical protein